MGFPIGDGTAEFRWHVYFGGNGVERMHAQLCQDLFFKFGIITKKLTVLSQNDEILGQRTSKHNVEWTIIIYLFLKLFKVCHFAHKSCILYYR